MKIIIFVLAAILGSFQLASAQNLVTNPGFETFDLTGWDVTPAPSGAGLLVIGIGAGHSGEAAVGFAGLLAGEDDILSQTLDTSAASTFDVSFFVNNNDPNNLNGFRVTFGNTTLLDLVNTAPYGYTEYSFAGIAGTGNATTISFAGYNPGGYTFLDDISVTASLPEPSAWGLMIVGTGFLAFGAVRRRHTQAV